MKKLFVFIAVALLLALTATGALATEAVKINETNFPDEMFRDYVRSFDLNGTGWLEWFERSKVTTIDVDFKLVEDMTGLEHFPFVKVLRCAGNRIAKLDLSANKFLEQVFVSGNKLTALDTTDLKALKILSCYSNKITGLDLTKNKLLQELVCNANQLTKLDLSRNVFLTYLNCRDNALTALNVQKNTRLKTLYCGGNALTDLDTSRNAALIDLRCSDNALLKLNLHQNTNLNTLHCANNRLVCLDLSKNPSLKELDASGNCRHVTAVAGKVFLSDFTGFFASKAYNWDGAAERGTVLTLTGKGKVTYMYKVSMDRRVKFTLKVDPSPAAIPITKVKISLTKVPYTGKAYIPEVIVKAEMNGEEIYLLRDVDYTVTFEDNVEAGTAKVIVKGIGYFTGEIVKEFKIKKAAITSVALAKKSLPYTGKAVKPKVTVKAKVNGKTVVLEKGKDYTVTYENNVNVGTGTLTVTGTGSFKGTFKKNFNITQAKIAKAQLKKTTWTYAGKPIKPSVTVKADLGGELVKLTQDTDYTVTYKYNKKPGVGVVIVNGIGNFKGSFVLKFTINEP